MTPARIAELLKPFLAPLKPARSSNRCHSEPGRSRGEEPALHAPLHEELSVECDSEEAFKFRHSEPAEAGEEPAVLSPSQLQHISTYVDLLLRWNARINLTAVRDPEEVVTRHFGESLFAARHLFPRVGAGASSAPAAQSSAVSTLADIGSGAGFPGLPIKLWAPHIALTLIESNHKKATFLREAVRALTLTDVDIQTARAESMTGSSFDVVTMRAVERFETILLTAAAMLASAGRLALLISTAQLAVAQRHLATTSANFFWLEPHPIPLSNSRILAIACRKS